MKKNNVTIGAAFALILSCTVNESDFSPIDKTTDQFDGVVGEMLEKMPFPDLAKKIAVDPVFADMAVFTGYVTSSMFSATCGLPDESIDQSMEELETLLENVTSKEDLLIVFRRLEMDYAVFAELLVKSSVARTSLLESHVALRDLIDEELASVLTSALLHAQPLTFYTGQCDLEDDPSIGPDRINKYLAFLACENQASDKLQFCLQHIPPFEEPNHDIALDLCMGRFLKMVVKCQEILR
jgi:hypothetical protein